MEEKKNLPATVSAARTSGEMVAAYLRDNPDFLIEYPDIASSLTPPTYDDGDGVVDFSRFLIDRLRAEVAALKSRESTLLSAVETNVAGQARIHRAALKLLGAEDAARFAQAIEVDLLAILDIEFAALCFEPSITERLDLGGRGGTVKTGQVAKMLGKGREAVLRPATATDSAFLAGAGEEIRSLALVRIVFGRKLPPGMLVLGAVGTEAFQPEHGTDLLVFLARIAETRLRQWLTPTA